MCGLAGYANLTTDKKPIDERILNAMQQSLAHRGPDGHGIWKSDKHQIGFAHRRLSIVDLSDAGQQPFINIDQSVVLVFNGEIYNYQALRAQLESLRHRFLSRTDTEVLIHAYEEWGIDMLSRLEGMFAFALFDVKRNELFLIRDRMGIKPLYFSTQAGYLSFASEIKALWRLPFMKQAICDLAYYHYLTFMVTPAPYTIYKGVYKLPAGFYAKLDADRRLSFHEWYSPIQQLSSQEQKQFNDEQFCVEGIRCLLRQSIKKRMMSDVPFGAFLSGGIDSSLNVALMAAEVGKVKTFTVAFSDGPESNELEWARLVAKKFDTEHHEIIISEKEACEFYETMVDHLDEPLADCVCIPFYHVAKLAKNSGVTVVQVGEGSDELFFGYDMYAKYHKLHNRFSRPTRFIPTFAKRAVSAMARPILSHKPHLTDILHNWSRNRNLFWGGAIAYNEQQKQTYLQQAHLQQLSPIIPDPIVEKICAGLQQTYDSHTIVDYHLKKLHAKDPQASYIKQMLYLELKQRLPELLLMRADKMSMATSVEARVPFLDHRLVEFALAIPDHLKYKNGETKYIFKKACEGIIPHDVIYRKKVGFAAPIVRWHTSKNYFYKHFQKSKLTVDLKGTSYSVALQQWVLQNFEATKRRLQNKEQSR